MEKFITNFDTTAELAAFSATTDFGRPHVPLTEDDSKVHYFEDPYNGHEYVDLGLPSGTKWATMNVGASSETDYGNYYQYGKGASQYATTSGDSNYSGTEDPLDSSVDTAVQVWGGQWHMPTKAQIKELIDSYRVVNNRGLKMTLSFDACEYLKVGTRSKFSQCTLDIVGDNAKEKDDFNAFLRDIVLDYPKIIKIQSNELTVARNSL